MGYRKKTPNGVARTLRQEAGFGCAVCGHPFIEYHHIVEWSEENHHRPEDMVALCPTHHAEIGKTYKRDRQYELKQNPYNQQNGHSKGALKYDKRDLLFKVGGVIYENTPTLINFFNQPIISYRIEDGQAKISLNLMDQHGNKFLTIIDNEIDFRINNLWDFEYSHNTATAKYGPRDIALKLDFRGPEAKVEGKIWLGKKQLILKSDYTNIENSIQLNGGKISGCKVGIQLGPNTIPPPFKKPFILQ